MFVYGGQPTWILLQLFYSTHLFSFFAHVLIDLMLMQYAITNSNNASTWGIAIHRRQRLIAVCANSFEITVFNMAVHPSMKKGGDANNFKSVLGSDSQCRLVGHENNIPNIDFSECGTGSL